MSDPDATHDVTLAEIEAARERIGGLVHRTPLLSSSTAAGWVTAASGIRLADDRLYLKAEHLQKTGSFKARGMSNRIATLTPEARSRGAITLSAGNAGQAYAWAGRAAGVPVTVVMPAGAVRSKVDACRGYGARVVLHGAHVGEALAELERIREAEGLTYCHPFDDPMVIAGNGTAGPRADRRPARCRRGGRRGRRRRADQRDRRGGQGASTDGPGLRRRAGAFECAVAGARAWRDRAHPARERRRRTRCPVCRGVDARDGAPLRGRRDPHRRPNDPGRSAVHARARQAAPRARRCRGARRGPRWARADPRRRARGGHPVGGNVEIGRLGELLERAATLPGAVA